MDDKCVFCNIASKKIPASVVYEDTSIMAFEDIKPQAPVHVIVIPKTHIERVSDIADTDKDIVAVMAAAANRIAAKRGIVERGYRLVVNCNRDAGQEVFHLHMHLLGGRKMGWPPG